MPTPADEGSAAVKRDGHARAYNPQLPAALDSFRGMLDSTLTAARRAQDAALADYRQSSIDKAPATDAAWLAVQHLGRVLVDLQNVRGAL